MGLLCFRHSGIVYSNNTILPPIPQTPPHCQTGGRWSYKKSSDLFIKPQIHRYLLHLELLVARRNPRACEHARGTFSLPAKLQRGVNVNLDFPIYFTYTLFNASLPALMTSAECLLKVR